MRKIKLFMLIALLNFSALSIAQNKMVGGAEMYPSKNIIENAVNSEIHTTLVTAVKAADLVTTLQSDGPFTVFAPTNSAFEKVPADALENLLKPENKKQLQTVLTYHVVAGNYMAKDVVNLINKNNGKAKVKTVSGNYITLMLDGNSVIIQDNNGNKSKVTIADVKQSNGVIHVIDTVLLP
ncbi:fasciclin domain-containing protein [Psychroflexus sp. ALD_RP9]|uniref:fasciclin domain-containing protein n=1 Tax=Psychroflexus sp. ALD_RP9 TaxID=2777186 RepID=UPI001A9021D3|nr:fasciclin domain-containing protein [Psychroflexus sp. ALD_RP9]QSS97720.1 fasciclin domain-containing protein [Psychroflexus sp. ALD_RP9]